MSETHIIMLPLDRLGSPRRNPGRFPLRMTEENDPSLAAGSAVLFQIGLPVVPLMSIFKRESE